MILQQYNINQTSIMMDQSAKTIRNSLLYQPTSRPHNIIYSSSSRPSIISHQTNNQSIQNIGLEQSVIAAINDKSHPPIKKKNIYDFVAEYTSSFPIIPPQNKYLLLWHGVIMFIIFYYLFEVGLLLAYGTPVWDDIITYLIPVNITFIICLLSDCIVNLFKAYYSKGLLIKNHRLIAKKYIPIHLIIDLVAIVAITVPFAANSYALNWLKLLFLPKAGTLFAIDKQYIRITQLSIGIHTFYLLSRLMMLLVLGSHYLGIFFYMIDYYVYSTNYYGPNTPALCWIYNAQAFSEMILLLPWYGQYQYTMYYSIGTMTTIAYGDITPLNPLETIYTVFALLVYTVCFAYILSQVLRILMQAQANKFQHTNTLLIITNMMRDKMISDKVQVKVRSFYEKMWKEQVYRNRAIQQDLIDNLPQKIRNQLFQQLYESMFESMGFKVDRQPQKNYIQTDFMINIANSIRQQRLVQGHSLYKQKQLFNFQQAQSHCLYYIKPSINNLKHQNIKLLINRSSENYIIQIGKITHGTIGYHQFLTGEIRTHQANVIRSVIAYKLPRKQFLTSLSQSNEHQREKICLITQNISRKLCYICKESGSHQFTKCPYATYQPNKYKVIVRRKYTKLDKNKQRSQTIFQNNSNNNQRKFRKFNTLQNFTALKDNPYKIRNKYDMLVSNPYYSKLIHSPLKKSKIMTTSFKSSQLKHNMNNSLIQKDKMIQDSLILDKNNQKRGIDSLMQGLTIKQVESEQQINQDDQLKNQKKSIMVNIKNKKQAEEYGSNIFDDQQVNYKKYRPSPLKNTKNFLQQSKYSMQNSFSKDQSDKKLQKSISSLQSSFFSQSSSSSQSSQDLQNYMKETQNYINHLEYQQNTQNIKQSIKNKIQTNLKMSKSAFLMNLNNHHKIGLNDRQSINQQISVNFDKNQDLKQTIRRQVKNNIRQSVKGFMFNQNIRSSLSEQKLSRSSLQMKQPMRNSLIRESYNQSPLIKKQIYQKKLSQSELDFNIITQQVENDDNPNKYQTYQKSQKFISKDYRQIIQEEFDKIQLQNQIDQIQKIQEIYLKNAIYMDNYHPSDVIKEYQLYHPQFNVSVVVSDFNNEQGFTKIRRHIQEIKPYTLRQN